MAKPQPPPTQWAVIHLSFGSSQRTFAKVDAATIVVSPSGDSVTFTNQEPLPEGEGTQWVKHTINGTYHIVYAATDAGKGGH